MQINGCFHKGFNLLAHLTVGDYCGFKILL